MVQRETPREKAMVALGLLAVCAGVIVLLLAFVLGFHLQSSPRADADTRKAQLVAVPAVIALVAGVLELTGRRRRWALAVGWLGAAAVLVAVVLLIVLPGGRHLPYQ